MPTAVTSACGSAREDGVLRLWSHGFAGFVSRDVIYPGIRIGLYPTVRSWLAGGKEKADIGLPEKIAAGACTGALGSALANPLDVVRVRMAVQGGRVDAASGLLVTGMHAGEAPRWRSSLHCLAATASEEGLAGLWRGVGPTMGRAALLSAGQLASYDHTKTVLRRLGWAEEGSQLHVIAALVSGLVATTVCHPADVVKSRLMMGRASDSSVSVLSAARQILVHEGPLGFGRGWVASYARLGPCYFIQMPIVEAARSWLGVGAL